MKLSSPGFKPNKPIPAKYACQGEDINPELNISEVPEGAESLALIMDDPDAPGGTWVHWVVWSIPADTKVINEDSVPGTQGVNSWGNNEYGGPCPPSGEHRYVFKVYALDINLDLDETSNKNVLEQAMKGHVLASAELTGLYSKE
ncbi:YbhB/YbcL family Raf kinase inhibitor-like protein|nr:YbhB/YbcL family Raf kinase inhibitor-like protein [archaeon]